MIFQSHLVRNWAEEQGRNLSLKLTKQIVNVKFKILGKNNFIWGLVCLDTI